MVSFCLELVGVAFKLWMSVALYHMGAVVAEMVWGVQLPVLVDYVET